MRNQKSIKFLSFLLALVMIFSMLPISVFGDGESDTERQLGLKTQGQADGTWGWYNFEGLRCSLYFAEIDKETMHNINENYKGRAVEGVRWAEEKGLLQYTQVGDTVDICLNRANYSPSKLFYTGDSVFDKMYGTNGTDGTINSFKFQKVNYSDIITDSSSLVVSPKEGKTYISWPTKYSQTVDTLFKTSGTVDSHAWNKLFLQIDNAESEEDWAKADVAYLKPILDKITEDAGYEISEDDFKAGIFTINDSPKYGVYKFYFEPESIRYEDNFSSKYLFTIRDAITYGKKMRDLQITYGGTNSDGSHGDWNFFVSATTRLLTLARSTFISKGDAFLGLKGNSSINASANNYDSPSSDFYQSGGLGIIYGCPKGEFPEFDVNTPVQITTYAMIDKVKLENGQLNITYKDPEIDSEMEDINFRLDADGNLTNIPIIEDIKYGDTYTAYLNDIVTTKYDLRKAFDGNNTKWLNTDLVSGLKPVTEKNEETGQMVTTFNGTLNANTNDIAGYRFGMMVDSDAFIEQMATILNYRGDNVTGDLTNNGEVEGVPIYQAINDVARNNESNSAYLTVIMSGESIGIHSVNVRNMSGNSYFNSYYGNGASQGTDGQGTGAGPSGLRANLYHIVVNSATQYSFMAQKTNDDGDTITYINFSGDSWNRLIDMIQEYDNSDRNIDTSYIKDYLFEILADEVITVGALIGGKNDDTNEVELNKVGILNDKFKAVFDPEEGVMTEKEYINALEEKTTGSTSLNNYNRFKNTVTKTESNTLVLRYIIVPNPVQINMIKVYEAKPDGTKTWKETVIETATDLEINTTTKTVTIKEPTYTIQNKTPEIVRWVTNPDYPTIDMRENNPEGELPREYDKEGTTQDDIPDYPTDPVTSNLYVEWEIVVPVRDDEEIDGRDTVPQWRLSKFTNSVVSKTDTKLPLTASMSLTLHSDNSSHVSTTFKPSGTYRFDTVNANGQVNNNSKTPANMIMSNNIFHSSTFAYNNSSDTISHNKPYANIKLDATLNSVKSDNNGKLIVANWIPASYGNLNDIADYKINGATLPAFYNTLSQYTKTAFLSLKLKNKDVYDHEYTVYKHPWSSYSCSVHGSHSYTYCACYTKLEHPSPTYYAAIYNLGVTFDRYIQTDTSSRKLTVQPKITESNAKTTLKYQLNENLTIYPEYGMLLAKDDGNSNNDVIKFVISDKARTIAPVVYQTLEHKVYVVPTSSGSSVATDTRALTQARTIGESGKQVIYKGANVNTTFQLYRTDAKNSKALLTVKTYALDFKDKSKTNNIDVKTADEHKSLLNS